MSTWVVVPNTSAVFTYRWGAPPFIYTPVTVLQLTPLRFTATAHGIPDQWPVAIPDLPSLQKLQAVTWPPGPCDITPIRSIDANTLEFNLVDASRINAAAATTTGNIAYQTPVNLTGFTGSFVVSSAFGVTPPLLTVAAVVDNTGKTVVVSLTGAQTAALAGTNNVFSLLMTSPTNVVTWLDSGAFVVDYV